MKNIARATNQEREEFFAIASASARMPEAVIEKDFWVCYTLDHLFHKSEFGNNIVFKGGTSLSKAFGLINRFKPNGRDLLADKFKTGIEYICSQYLDLCE
ncbi:hypothetical protein AGMMS49983_22210 [Clostridia bacterium]|nr:hypothetical protein AGMMS49983_22210 [Clostridia bacterium]